MSSSPPESDSTASWEVLPPRWEIKSVLGQGRYGKVFLAYDKQHDHDVAIKKARGDSAKDVQQFEREAKARSLKHENIAQIYELCESETGACLIVMEYAPGQPLTDILAHRDPMPPDEALAILSQVATALDYAHEKGFVHCDIKPANIVVDHKSSPGAITVRVVDFGLAKLSPERCGGDPRGGSLPYAAPEQRFLEEYDRQADVYALGIVASEMLCGMLPYPDGDALEHTVVPQFGGDLSEDIKRVLARAVSRATEDRYTTAGTFLDELIAAFNVSHEPHRLDLRHLMGECCFCRKQVAPYNPNRDRYCCTGKLPAPLRTRFDQHNKFFPTIFPLPIAQTEKDTSFAPADPRCQPFADVFAIARSDDPSPSPRALPPLPYEVDPVLSHLRCGNPTLHNLGPLAHEFDFEDGKITVCDMSTYMWSNTLKDPRAWAIINIALQYNIQHLGVWTAGNAGLSLAKMAHCVNRLMSEKRKITVHCFAFEESLSPPIQSQLERFHADVCVLKSRPSGGKVYSPDRALQALNAQRSTEARIPSDHFWDVSDGWDGVGLYLYRLLCRQLCMHLRPQYIVAPIGTGNLFLGLYFGLRDWMTHSETEKDDCRLIGVVPAGQSIVENYESFLCEDYDKFEESLHLVKSRDKTTPPGVDKLITEYTPLLASLCLALRDRSTVTVVQADKTDWLNLKMKQGDVTAVVGEPSSLLAFTALKKISEMELKRKPKQYSVVLADADVVVMNTGCGIVGH